MNLTIAYIDTNDHNDDILSVTDNASGASMRVVAQYIDDNGKYVGFGTDAKIMGSGIKSYDDSSHFWYDDAEGRRFIEQSGLDALEVTRAIESWVSVSTGMETME
jgi:hypothetical protein